MALFQYFSAIRLIRKLVADSKCLQLNTRALVLLAFSVLFQIFVVYTPVTTVLHLLDQEPCDDKIRTLKRFPKVYDMYIIAGLLDQLTMLVICLYLTNLEKS